MSATTATVHCRMAVAAMATVMVAHSRMAVAAMATAMVAHSSMAVAAMTTAMVAHCRMVVVSRMVIVSRQMPVVVLCHSPISIEVARLAIVTTPVAHEHRWTAPEEPAPVIVMIDMERYHSVEPRNGTEEIGQFHKTIVLPSAQHQTEVSVAAVPPDAEHIGMNVHTHQIVQINFIDSIILGIRQVQFVSHLIREEQSLLPCHSIAHCVGRDSHDHHHCHHHHLLHSRISYL